MKFTSVKRKLRVLFCLICIMIITASVPTGSSILTGVAKLIKSEGKKTAVIVIDTGHGGRDGGAESSSGTCEKDINLAIALHVKELAEKMQIKPSTLNVMIGRMDFSEIQKAVLSEVKKQRI